MFDIQRKADGAISISGRLDAASAPQAETFLSDVSGDVTLDFTGLDYISSAGLGQVFALYRRLSTAGSKLTLTGMSPQVKYVFSLARLDKVMEIR